MTKRNFLVPAFALLLFSTFSFGQDGEKAKRETYKENPVWIEMMNDPNANYFETVEAFRLYYEDRALPEEPKEIRMGDSFEGDVGIEEGWVDGVKTEKEKEKERRRDESNEPRYASEVRAFKGWFYGNQPWVRTDGSIISSQERQAIIDKQQEELREAEAADKKNNSNR